MVSDQQVKRLWRLSGQTLLLETAAAKAGLDPKTARKYLQDRRLPSEMRQKHTWRTRPDPFADHWEELRQRLAVEPGLQAKTLLVGPVDVIIDSTGLKVYGAGEWQAEKHGERGRRTWRKLHLAVNPESGEILASELTSNEVGDPRWWHLYSTRSQVPWPRSPPMVRTMASRCIVPSPHVSRRHLRR